MNTNLPDVVRTSRFSEGEIALLRNTYAKGLSDTEISLFLKQAESMDLNPFTKEIYGMVISGKLTLITSIAGLRKIAVSSGVYLGCTIDVAWKLDGKIDSATARVKKLVAGHVAEFTAQVFFDEYNTNNNNWKKMPVTMIRKVAEAHALRMAFPSAENLYEESEVGSIRAVGPRISERSKEMTQKISEVEARPKEEHPEPGEDDFQLTLSTDPAPAPKDEFDLGAYIIPTGANTGKRLNELERSKLEDMLKWAYKQEKLSPKWQEYVTATEKYLEQIQ